MAFKTGLQRDNSTKREFVETYRIWNIWRLQYSFGGQEYLACTSVYNLSQIRELSLEKLKMTLDSRAQQRG